MTVWLIVIAIVLIPLAGLFAAADAARMPRRLALGSTAFDNIQRALQGRLDELLPQRQVAYAADKV